MLGVMSLARLDRSGPAVARLDLRAPSPRSIPPSFTPPPMFRSLSLGTTLFIWTLALAYQTGASRRLSDAAVTGVLLAVAGFDRPDSSTGYVRRRLGRLAPWARPGAIAPFDRSSCSRSSPSRRSAGVTPWLVAKRLVHGEFVAIKSTFGYAFWQGNCSLSEGTDKVVRRSVERVLDRDQSTIGLSEPEPQALGSASRGRLHRRHRAFQRRLSPPRAASPSPSARGSCSGVHSPSLQPTRPLQPALPAAAAVFHLLRRNQSQVEGSTVSRAAPGADALRGLGTLPGRPALRKRLIPTIITAALIVIFHSLTIVSARFHIPIEPLLGLWGRSGSRACGRLPSRRARCARDIINRGSKRRRTHRDQKPACRCASRVATPVSLWLRESDVSEDQARDHPESR